MNSILWPIQSPNNQGTVLWIFKISSSTITVYISAVWPKYLLFESSQAISAPVVCPGGAIHSGACSWCIKFNGDFLFSISSSSFLFPISLLSLTFPTCHLNLITQTPPLLFSPVIGCSLFILTNNFTLGNKVYIVSLAIYKDLLVGNNQVLVGAVFSIWIAYEITASQDWPPTDTI